MKRIEIIAALSLFCAVSAHAIDIQEYKKLATEYAQKGADLANDYFTQAATYATQAQEAVMPHVVSAYNYSCNVPVGKIAAGLLATGVTYKVGSKITQSLAYRSICADLDECYRSIVFDISCLNCTEPKLIRNPQDVIASINERVEKLQYNLYIKNVDKVFGCVESPFYAFATSVKALTTTIRSNLKIEILPGDEMYREYVDLSAIQAMQDQLAVVKMTIEDIKSVMQVDTVATLSYDAKNLCSAIKNHPYVVKTLLGAGAAFVAYKKGYTLNDVSAFATSAYDAIQKKASAIFTK